MIHLSPRRLASVALALAVVAIPSIVTALRPRRAARWLLPVVRPSNRPEPPQPLTPACAGFSHGAGIGDRVARPGGATSKLRSASTTSCT